MTDWLPEHQHHVLFTLSHVDSVIDRLGSVLHDYLLPGPMALERRFQDGLELVVLGTSAPLPEAVPRLAADAFNQLRSALEHTLFAEVEFQLGRALDVDEAKGIEMPVAVDEPYLVNWSRQKRRRDLHVLQPEGVLGQRITKLQPYGDDSHPMKVLAEHTNLSKHRTPSTAALRLGAVVPDFEVPGLVVAGEYEDDRPLNPGDVVASVPAGVPAPLSIWPKIGIRRPHTGQWVVLMHELRTIEEWVRATAIPTLIEGHTDVDPICPHLDISRGYSGYETARGAAQSTPAAERHQQRIAAHGLREDLPSVFKQFLPQVPADVVVEYLRGLSDVECIELLNRYMRVRENRGQSSATDFLRRQLRKGQ